MLVTGRPEQVIVPNERYAASGIVNDNVETTGILEYEEIIG